MNENRLVEKIAERAGGAGKGLVTGIGDDCAVMRYTSDSYLLLTSDMLTEGTHFRIADCTYEQVGRKSVAVSISDIAAMGGVPSYVNVSLGVPPGTRTRDIMRLYDGILAVCRVHGARLAGGDTVRCGSLTVDVTAVGTVEKERLARRSGARPGDLLMITGPVRDGKRRHLGFTPRLREARLLTSLARISSMIDVSDGIAVDARRLCRASGAGCRIYEGALPLEPGLSLEDALYYGESFELLFTAGQAAARKILSWPGGGRERAPLFVIGEIIPKKEGVALVGEDGKKRRLGTEGFRHL